MSEFVVLDFGIYRTDQILSVSDAPDRRIRVRFINGAEVYIDNSTDEARDETNSVFRKALLGDKMLTLVEGKPGEDDAEPARGAVEKLDNSPLPEGRVPGGCMNNKVVTHADLTALYSLKAATGSPEAALFDRLIAVAKADAPPRSTSPGGDPDA